MGSRKSQPPAPSSLSLFPAEQSIPLEVTSPTLKKEQTSSELPKGLKAERVAWRQALEDDARFTQAFVADAHGVICDAVSTRLQKLATMKLAGPIDDSTALHRWPPDVTSLVLPCRSSSHR